MYGLKAAYSEQAHHNRRIHQRATGDSDTTDLLREVESRKVRLRPCPPSSVCDSKQAIELGLLRTHSPCQRLPSEQNSRGLNAHTVRQDCGLNFGHGPPPVHQLWCG